MPHNTSPFRRRMIKRETVGELAALVGTALFLLLMMSQPDWDQPAYQIVWGGVSVGLVALGSFLMLSRRREGGRHREGATRE